MSLPAHPGVQKSEEEEANPEENGFLSNALPILVAVIPFAIVFTIILVWRCCCCPWRKPRPRLSSSFSSGRDSASRRLSTGSMTSGDNERRPSTSVAAGSPSTKSENGFCTLNEVLMEEEPFFHDHILSRDSDCESQLDHINEAGVYLGPNDVKGHGSGHHVHFQKEVSVFPQEEPNKGGG